MSSSWSPHCTGCRSLRSVRLRQTGSSFRGSTSSIAPWTATLPSNGPYAAIASLLLIDNEATIRRLVARYGALVARHLKDPGPPVVTHGEIHPGNVMETSEGWVIVDWDTALLAPPERDLWRLARGGGGSILRAYADATGTTPDERLLELYAIRWDLAEIASFAAEFREPHEDTEDSRRGLEILESVVRRLPA